MVILIYTSIWISYSSFSNKISEVLTVWIIQIKMDTLTHPQPSKNPHALVSIFLDPIFLEIFLLHKGLYPNCPEYDQSIVSLFVVWDNTSNTWKFVEVIGGIIPTSQRDYLWQHWVSYTWIIPIAVRGSSTAVWQNERESPAGILRQDQGGPGQDREVLEAALQGPGMWVWAGP